MNLDPLVTFIIVLLIGIVAGVIAQRGLRASWLSRRLAGGIRSDVTGALVGIATERVMHGDDAHAHEHAVEPPAVEQRPA